MRSVVTRCCGADPVEQVLLGRHGRPLAPLAKKREKEKNADMRVHSRVVLKVIGRDTTTLLIS